MHPALQDPFLLAEIFNFLEDPYEDTKSSSIACALTCKTFLSPALDEIWRELTDIYPLLRLIPNIKSRDVIGGRVKLQTMYTENLLLPQDLERVCHYGRRVRILNNRCPFIEGRNQTAVDADPSLVFQLISLLGGRSLTPSIQLLYIVLPTRMDSAVACSSYLQLFLSPTLQNVNLYSRRQGSRIAPSNDLYAPVAWTFLHSLTSFPMPGLWYLNLETIPVPSEVLKSISRLGSLKRLDIRIHVLDKPHLSGIRHLSKLEYLTALHLHLEGTTSQSQTSPQPIVAFDSIKTLEFYGCVDSASLILAVFSFPNVGCIKVCPWKFLNANPVSALSWERCFSQLKNTGDRLCSLDLTGWPSVKSSLPWQSFAPLLTFHHLTHIYIWEPSVASLSNDNIVEMVSAWPKLQKLCIETNDATGLDHLALCHIAAGLPELTYLKMGVPLVNASPHALLAGMIPQAHSKLKRFSTYTNMLPIPSQHTATVLGPKQIYDVARFLDLLFPMLEDVDVSTIQDGSSIQDMIKGFQDIRRRERMRLEESDRLSPLEA